MWKKLKTWWMQDDLRIQAYEARTGQNYIREGRIKKGGQNLPPTTSRPPPPVSHESRK